MSVPFTYLKKKRKKKKLTRRYLRKQNTEHTPFEKIKNRLYISTLSVCPLLSLILFAKTGTF